MEPKKYSIPNDAKWFKCRSCGKKITMILNENMKKIPITEEGINHFIDCPDRIFWRKVDDKKHL